VYDSDEEYKENNFSKINEATAHASNKSKLIALTKG
jgi:hypothetical protein